MENARMKAVYVITERNDNKYWNRVGVAFVNRDGSLNVRLEALPVTGELHIRDFVVQKEASGATGRGFGSERATEVFAKSA
jgi:hypothetical protein